MPTLQEALRLADLILGGIVDTLVSQEDCPQVLSTVLCMGPGVAVVAVMPAEVGYSLWVFPPGTLDYAQIGRLVGSGQYRRLEVPAP